jgi:predicted DNA-binding protein (MmcQ/YjbR family)
MIKVEDLIQYCCNKQKAYIDYPFGKEPICIKVNNKIFAEIYPKEDNYKITLKCEPILADFFRSHYPGTVVRGYHCPPVQQPYRNTAYINKIDDNILWGMIDHSYVQVIKSFSKKVQREILDNDKMCK